MILYESRKTAAACRKAFIESVYGESENLYESAFKDAADFEAFMNTLIKPALPDGWTLSGDLSVDEEGVTHDDVILYKELDDGNFCVLSASLIDGKPWVAPEFSIEISNTKDPANETEEDSSYTFSSDDLQEFNSIYNSLMNEYAGRSFDFGAQIDPLKALISFVGMEPEDKNSLRYALSSKMRDEKSDAEQEPENNEEASEELNDDNEAENFEASDEVDDLISDSVKNEAEKEMNSWA